MVVLQVTNLRCIAIAEPEIEIAISIPIGQCKSPAIIGEVDPADGGKVSEGAIALIEKRGVAFSPTERATLFDHAQKGGPFLIW